MTLLPQPTQPNLPAGRISTRSCQQMYRLCIGEPSRGNKRVVELQKMKEIIGIDTPIHHF